MATLRCFEERQTHADWAHSRAQFWPLGASWQFTSHGSRAEFTGDQAMAADTVPKTVPIELALGASGSCSVSGVCS